MKDWAGDVRKRVRLDLGVFTSPSGHLILQVSLS